MLGMIAADPILGEFIAVYPSNRLRLALIAACVFVPIWFVVTVVLWQVDPGIAAPLTVTILFVASLPIGWYVAHFWNREVLLFEKGFYYREGAADVPILFSEVRALRQKAERRSYFGGRVRRDVYVNWITTYEGETIRLDNLYRKTGDLSARLELGISLALRARVQAQLQSGQAVPFGDTLTISVQGIHAAGRDLPWAGFAGYQARAGYLILSARPPGEWPSGEWPSGEWPSSEWHAISLDDIDNLRVLLEVLQQRLDQPARSGS